MVVLCMGLLCSCDANTEKVKEAAEQFVTAFNKKDKAAVYDMFPEIKSYKNLSIGDTISAKKDDIKVEFNDKDSVYEVTINEAEQQKLILKEEPAGKYTIVDSYNVFALDSLSMELGLKTGVPLKKLSDVEKSTLLDPDEDFIAFLSDENPAAANGNLVFEGGLTSWSRNYYGFSCQIQFGIRNAGQNAVSGDDYNMEIDIYDRLDGSYLKTETKEGISLAPGERSDVILYVSELYRRAYEGDGLSYRCRVNLKNMSRAQCLEKYATFTGEEYDAYKQKTDSIAKAMPEGIVEGDYVLEGKIADKYGIKMTLNVTGKGVSGTYYYLSQGAKRPLVINGTIDKNNKMKLKELNEKGEETGRFSGVFNGKSYVGRFENAKGKGMTFNLKVNGGADKDAKDSKAGKDTAKKV